MTRARLVQTGDDPAVRITLFKTNARRLLPATHPLNRMLDRTPDVIRVSELDSKLDDWLAVLEERPERTSPPFGSGDRTPGRHGGRGPDPRGDLGADSDRYPRYATIHRRPVP